MNINGHYCEAGNMQSNHHELVSIVLYFVSVIKDFHFISNLRFGYSSFSDLLWSYNK